MKKAFVKKDSYFDSVSLMLMSRELKTTSGVADAMVAMGTAMNIDLLKTMGFAASEFVDVTPNDLLIAIDASNSEALEAAIDFASEALVRKKTPISGDGAKSEPTSTKLAVEQLAGANMAVISLPGTYAVREAHKALQLGLHVMLFSDNVSLDDEIALKTMGREKGLLVMGPDCGTAIINGKPLCFANVVRRGPVGIVGASGTGIQEVTCLVDRAQSGISQAIGTGGRDLKNDKVGGTTMLMAIEALAQDKGTKVIVVISKPPAKSMADKVISALEQTGKPAVVFFIGLEPETRDAKSKVHFATNLEQTADMAIALTKNQPYTYKDFTLSDKDIKALIERETKGMNANQKFIRGYYTGGTLADEAWILLHKLTGAVFSNNQTNCDFVPPDPHKSIGHTVVDLGDDIFTVGRPHPMIDPSTRTDRMLAEIDDQEIAVVLIDLVLGYGSHEDPAGALVPTIMAMREAACKRGGYLPVLASITGTQSDFQNFVNQKAKLESIGCVVLPSNYQASMLAVKILEKVNIGIAERKGVR